MYSFSFWYVTPMKWFITWLDWAPCFREGWHQPRAAKTYHCPENLRKWFYFKKRGKFKSTIHDLFSNHKKTKIVLLKVILPNCHLLFFKLLKMISKRIIEHNALNILLKSHELLTFINSVTILIINNMQFVFIKKSHISDQCYQKSTLWAG